MMRSSTCGKLRELSEDECGSDSFPERANKSIDTFRHNKVEENYVALYSVCFRRGCGLDEENEKIERIYKVDSLTPQTRHIMEECYFNRKYAEVAEMLNISPSAVKSTL